MTVTVYYGDFQSLSGNYINSNFVLPNPVIELDSTNFI